MEWVDAAKHPQLLNYDGRATLGHKFVGTTDVAVADCAAVHFFTPQLGLRLLFELKKHVTLAALIQAQAILLCANLNSPDTKPAVVRQQPIASNIPIASDIQYLAGVLPPRAWDNINAVPHS